MIDGWKNQGKGRRRKEMEFGKTSIPKEGTVQYQSRVASSELGMNLAKREEGKIPLKGLMSRKGGTVLLPLWPNALKG